MAETPPPLRIDIVSDVVCPWCVIGFFQLQRALDEGGVTAEIHWHPFELNPRMPPGGQDLRAHLSEKYGTTPEQSRSARARITDLGAELGFRFAFREDSRIYNTFAAHQLVHLAGETGRAQAAKLALFEAYFGDGGDISDIDALTGIAGAIGLEEAEARAVLAAGSLGPVVRQAERSWTARGIRGVPAMVFQQKYLVTGAQGVEGYAGLLAQLAGAPAS